MSVDPNIDPTDPRKRLVWDRPADKVRDSAEAAYERTRGDRSLNSDARLARVAKTYVSTRDELQMMQGASGVNAQAALAAAKRNLFGTDDLVRNGSPADAAAIAVSYRDAQDRAARIETPEEAAELLARAEESGDELLARAVGAHVLARSPLHALGFGGAFDGVAEQYLNARPAQAQAYDDLVRLNHAGSVTDMWEFVSPKPTELSGMNDAQIETLAAGADQYAQPA
jgi:hypothetical protein